MIKIQKKNFDIEKEIKFLKDKHSNVGAVNSFIGYVRDLNDNMDVKYLDLEVYEEMAIKELSKIKDKALKKWNLIDCLIIHRYGKIKPGDTLIFNLELISPIRRGICHMKGEIFANGNLMTEGELMAQIIKR